MKKPPVEDEIPEDAVPMPSPRKRKKRTKCQAPGCDPLLGQVPPMYGGSVPVTFSAAPPTFQGSPWGRMT